ncbi:beta-ketoacyl synthase chain length factor [Rhodoferax sp.]|uniref:beta-ketoacyl synthase chain length factor n=1 Tax=Rhodoferax sp. TaxID=50421 RepID=UPI0025E6042C|nr:beta-ketoacyl synthase chain length factor [Rhodoferax sp.]
MTALTVFIDGVGLVGPGIADWAQGQAQLAGYAPGQWQKTVLAAPAHLPPAERRRAGAVIRVSQTVGFEAVAAAGIAARGLVSVFTSSGGDGVNCHEMCTALASDDRLISPTRFHNSVHNAASGYWGIATGAMAASTALCAFDGSFAAGLVEALTQAVVQAEPVLLVAFDTDYPEPLRACRPVPDTFGLALVLSPVRTAHSLGQISLHPASYLSPGPADVLVDAVLESQRQSIPAARGLPLLAALVRQQSGLVRLDYLDDCRLALEFSPC